MSIHRKLFWLCRQPGLSPPPSEGEYSPGRGRAIADQLFYEGYFSPNFAVVFPFDIVRISPTKKLQRVTNQFEIPYLAFEMKIFFQYTESFLRDFIFFKLKYVS